MLRVRLLTLAAQLLLASDAACAPCSDNAHQKSHTYIRSCPRTVEVEVTWRFHDARRGDNGDRYFTAIADGERTWMVARSRGPLGVAVLNEVGSPDAPDVVLRGDTAHNVAVLRISADVVVLLGGRSHADDLVEFGDPGLGAQRSRRLVGVLAHELTLSRNSTATPLFGGWPVLDGGPRVPGCFEGRSVMSGWCEFDGRLSAVTWRGRVWVYARSNIRNGVRAVQFTSVKSDEFIAAMRVGAPPVLRWAPWRPMLITGYRPAKKGEGIYFACVAAHPLEADALVALVPVSLPDKRESAIAVTFSRDGATWSPLVKVRDSAFAGERQVDHPACGVLKEKDDVVFYVQREVGGIREHESTNYLATPAEQDSSLAKVTIRTDVFANLTAASLRALDAGSNSQKPTSKRKRGG